MHSRSPTLRFLCRILFLSILTLNSLAVAKYPVQSHQTQKTSRKTPSLQQAKEIPSHKEDRTLRMMGGNENERNAIKSVVVVGGTHGNEYTGVWCVKALERQLQKQKDSNGRSNTDLNENGKRRHPSTPSYPFALSTLIGNPEATLANRRFLDADLNRQFSYKALVEEKQQRATTVEGRRAQELNDLLGPKFDAVGGSDNDAASSRKRKRTDVIIDLHTTTTNMGVTLIVGAGDPLTTSMAAYIKAKMAKRVTILMHTHTCDEDRPHVASLAQHAFTIEVGPVPQGLLRHDKVKETQEALDLALDFLQRHTEDPNSLETELKQAFPNGQVECLRSAPAKRKGEMSSKLTWPNSEENPNFPDWIVHDSIQDNDFHCIRTGDPLFVDLDGNLIPYDGSHGSPVRLMFVNEGGYYYASSGTGISVAMDDLFELGTGKLLSSISSISSTPGPIATNQKTPVSISGNSGSNSNVTMKEALSSPS